MNKIPSPKRMAILSHKLAVLAVLTTENLDEMIVDTEIGLELREAANNWLKVCEKFTDNVFGDNKIERAGVTYISELTAKVDTIIRHNYKKIGYEED